MGGQKGGLNSTPTGQKSLNQLTLLKDITDLLDRLGLKDLGHITTSNFLQITSYSVKQPEPSQEKMFVDAFLHKLLTANYNARYTYTKIQCKSLRENKTKPSQIQGIRGLSALFKKSSQTNKRETAQIHPMDVQMAVFHCADHFLKQLIVTKLSQCQYALPLLVPNLFNPKEIEFPLWTFQEIKKSWKTTDKSGKTFSKIQSVCKAETPMVAFFRLGSVSSSKSQLMNSLINEKHNTFFHRNCPGSIRTRLLMDGVVEIAWYCPSGKPTDKFTDCVAFCNLHGDAVATLVQWKILTEMSTINIVLLPELDENDSNMTVMKELMESSKPLICILTEGEDPICDIGVGMYKLGLKNRNQADVAAELREAIKQNLTEESLLFSVENVSHYKQRKKVDTDECKREIKVDTETAECRRGHDAAVQIMQLLEGKDPSTVKETFLPCQGKLWQDWSQISKELHRLKGENLEQDRSTKQNKMMAIRQKQIEKGLSELIKQFTVQMASLSVHEKKYFLKSVSNLLDEFTADKLSVLLQKYDMNWKNLEELKRSHNKSGQINIEQDLEHISEELVTATFGLEHFLREMGQVYEAWKSTQKNMRQKDKTIPGFPKMAAELMISGHPVELMDGDAAHVPLVWITAVLDELIKILGDRRVFVLSVLGLQSSGKSTMLNAMFGLQFAVSAGRCTRGAFMQLVKVSEEMKAELKFDYILVVDTEGLRALELAGKATVHHDNELATFVVGLGNMTLINIFGENPSEMQDVLQIVVQAFLRMRKVNLKPSCMFVHQNVSDVTAGEKNMEGRRRLQEKLDEMTKLAAKEEVCDAECFSDVIAFDIQKDVRYFAQLWEGSPPMAPPNPSYSENIQELKETILSHASQTKSFTLSEFKVRVGDLWKALLNENFVFSFKNTLEVAVYRKLEEEYCKWTWTLRSKMLKTEDQLHVRILNNKKLDVVTKDLLAEQINDTLKNVKDEMTKYFKNDKAKDILIQWEGKFHLKIEDFYSDLVGKATSKLNDVISQRNACKELDGKKEHHEKKLFDKSKELALSLKNTGSSEAELRKAFNSMWEEWVSDLQVSPIEDINIRQDILNIDDFFEDGLVQTCKKDVKSIQAINDYTPYVKMKRTFVKVFLKIFPVRTNHLPQNYQDLIKDLIISVTRKTDELVNSKPVSLMGYNRGYKQEIVQLVKTMVNESQRNVEEKFTFKREFVVDLSLSVCESASNKFEEGHKAFREANDPFIYLETKKPGYYSIFQIYCKGATSAAVLGSLICSELKEPILRSAYSRTAADIAEEMRTNIPAFKGNRSNMENHILRSLAEEENFDKYMKYIKNPREHFEDFIRGEVEKYMNGCTAEGEPRVLSMIKKHIENLQILVVLAAEKATKEVKVTKEGADMWLQTFSSELIDVLENRCADLLTNDESGEVNDFDLLLEFIKTELSPVIDQLNRGLSNLSDLRMTMFRVKPDEILIEHFCQCCWVQCPFCKAVCVGSVKNHPGDHMVPLHRVNGINGWHSRGTGHLSCSFCTTLISSDKSFFPSPEDEKSIPYKEYRSAGGKYAEWSITPDPYEQTYWQWFVCQFQSELEDHYKRKFQGHGEIPPAWKDLLQNKQVAINSLETGISTEKVGSE